MGMASAWIFDLRIGLALNLGAKQTPKSSLATDNITEIIHLEKLPASNVSQGMGSNPILLWPRIKGTNHVKGLERVLPKNTKCHLGVMSVRTQHCNLNWF